jgi:uncharacterized protein YcfL
MGVTKHISGNFITFTMSLENNITAKNIQIEAVHGKLKKTTALSIEKYEKPVTYDYRVFLNYSEITLTQDNTASKNNPKKVTATIKNQQGTTFSDKHVT